VETHILFFVAAVVAGAINSLAGGGGLVTFPLMALVVAPVVADATSALALLPAYRPPCGASVASWPRCLAGGCGCSLSPACWAA
jgi:hypothetical protein